MRPSADAAHWRRGSQRRWLRGFRPCCREPLSRMIVGRRWGGRWSPISSESCALAAFTGWGSDERHWAQDRWWGRRLHRWSLGQCRRTTATRPSSLGRSRPCGWRARRRREVSELWGAASRCNGWTRRQTVRVGFWVLCLWGRRDNGRLSANVLKPDTRRVSDNWHRVTVHRLWPKYEGDRDTGSAIGVSDSSGAAAHALPPFGTPGDVEVAPTPRSHPTATACPWVEGRLRGTRKCARRGERLSSRRQQLEGDRPGLRQLRPDPAEVPYGPALGGIGQVSGSRTHRNHLPKVGTIWRPCSDASELASTSDPSRCSTSPSA